MSSCLGIFIEPNFIKYAKISKDHDVLRVESFGIKFYDKLGEAINQIISDTYSFKTPISINLSEESYQYFTMFTLLNKADLRKDGEIYLREQMKKYFPNNEIMYVV